MLFKRSSKSIALTLPHISSLSSLTKLNISGRNLGEGALTSDICYLSLLETLILCHNNFVSLPPNLCQLAKLHCLELSGCNKLESLLEPPSIIVDLDSCASLEIVPNPTKPYIHRKSRSDCLLWKRTYYYGGSCFKLAANALRMLKRHLKAIGDAKLIFVILIPGSETFEWFTHWSKDSSISIVLPPNLRNDSLWMGIALCCVLVPASNNGASRDVDISIYFLMHSPSAGPILKYISLFQSNSISGRICQDHL
ncbi:Uncharacterized protein TCM_027906 [Theobroma cacao]|uniref:C-JID domain-containing protein n=1 Tax=Theobroma cacao TaxID=3641 RepID=A0A061GB57_THECC|nr:Uncharacterized protein TCM_027906 [Theobroma cacao]